MMDKTTRFPETTHLTASGLGVGIMYVANQDESGLARNQWESGMAMVFGVTSVGSAVTVPGKQTQRS